MGTIVMLGRKAGWFAVATLVATTACGSEGDANESATGSPAGDASEAASSSSTTTQPSPSSTEPEEAPSTTSPSEFDPDQAIRITAIRLARYGDADRFVVEFNHNLDGYDLVEADEVRWSDHFSIVTDDQPHTGECGERALEEGTSTFVNLQVPSDYLIADDDMELAPTYSSDTTAKVTEVGVCGPHEGHANFAIGLTEPGEVDGFFLGDPGRLVLDIR